MEKIIKESEGNQIFDLQLNPVGNKIIECLHDFGVILEQQNNEWQEQSSLAETFTEDQCVFSTSVYFNKDGTEIAIGYTDGHVAIWKQQNQQWELAQILEQHQGSITKVTFSGQKDILVAADQKGCLIIWEKQDDSKYQLQWQYQNNGQSIDVVYFNSNSSILLIGEDKQAKIWKQQKNKQWIVMQIFDFISGDVKSVEMTADNKSLCFGLSNGLLKVFDYVGE